MRLPLTPLQAAMLAAQQLAPASDRHLEQWVLQLPEPVDPQRWHLAWQQGWRRHPALRAGFGGNDGGTPYQWLGEAEADLPLTLHDLRDAGAGAQARWEELLAEDRALGMDLGRPPCSRLLLAQLGPHDWRACWTVHHILVDGRSMTALLREVFATYDGSAGTTTGPRDEPQEADEAFQNHLLALAAADDSALAAARNHWQQALAGSTPLGSFACERQSPLPPPAQAAAQTETLERLLPPELSRRLHAAAAANAVTVNTLMQAAWGWALGLFSGCADGVFATLRAGRRREQRGVGLFVQVVPVRVRGWSGDDTVADWLQSLRARQVAAREHGWVGTAQIGAWLGMGGEPWLTALLAFERDRPEREIAAACGGERGRRFALRERSSFPLILSAWEREPMGLSLAYDAQRYPGWAMQELLDTVQHLLGELVGDPGRRLREIPLVPAQALRQRQAWQGREVAPPPRPLLQAGFEAMAGAEPERLCLVDGPVSWSYGDLETAANRLAHRLVALGVGPEMRVALWLEKSVRLPMAILAVLKAGGAYLPLDRAVPVASLARMLALSSARLLLVDTELPEGLVLPDGCRALALAAEAEALASGPSPRPAVALRGDHLAYGIFTSGTTGTPKLVGVEHRNAANLVAHAVEELLEPADLARVPFIDNVAFDSSVSQLFVTWAHGGSLLFHADLTTVFRGAAEVAPTAIGTVPSALLALLDDADLPATVRVVGLGGEAIPAPLLERLAQHRPPLKVLNYYGPTETTCYALVARVLGPEAPEASASGERGRNLGHPIRNTRLHLLEDGGRPVPLGAPGELHLAGLGVARGYLNAPAQTAAAFLPDPSVAGGRLYRSGDLGFQAPDGSVQFLGRRDQQVKLRGQRIDLEAIESALTRHPALQDAVVVLQHDRPGLQRVVAYIVPTATAAAPSHRTLHAFLKAQLPPALIPTAFVAIPRRPLTANGKLDRRALPAPSFAGDMRQRVAPSTPLERQLHDLWAEVLGHSDFGITDEFFMVGGHSLSAAGLASAIASRLGKTMPVAALFQASSIQQQVDWLTADRPAKHRRSNLVALQPQGARPPLFVVHGWGGTLGAFLDLARALAPERPVLGLQAFEAGVAKPDLPGVRALAADYADQLLQHHPEGPIHLLGYSAGGWYAHAVAMELQARGANLGLFGVLDSGVGARVHRRLGAALLWRHGLRRLKPPGSLRRQLRQPCPWRPLLRRKLAHSHQLLYRYLHLRGPSLGRLRQEEPFLALLKRDYRPQPSALVADVFAPEQHLPELQQLWGFYARGGVRCHPLFSQHLDFYRPELAPSLAEAIAAALERAERERG